MFGFRKLTKIEKEASIYKYIACSLMGLLLIIGCIFTMGGAEIMIMLNGNENELVFSVPQLPSYLVIALVLVGVYLYGSTFWDIAISRIWKVGKAIIKSARDDSPYKNHPELLSKG